MRRLILYILTFITITAFGQEENEKVLFVVDSIPIFDELTKEEGNLPEELVDYVNVVTNKADFGKYEIYDFDKIAFVFTKEYSKRSDELKKIPTFPNKFYKKEGKYCLKGSSKPYTGRYFEYYLTGFKKDEGFLKGGIDDGHRKTYYKDGNLKLSRNYSKGVKNGEFEKYFSNGKLDYKGAYKNDKKVGVWRRYYSTGTLKHETIYKAGKQKQTDLDKKVKSYFSKGQKLFAKANYEEAVIQYSKAIDLNPNLNELYFHRSRAYLYDFKFDKSLIDCDKAIELEPLYKDAYSNRAFVRIRKYEFKDGRILSQNKEVTVYASKNNVEIPIEEKTKICNDLRKGYELGDTKPMIIEAIKEYCE